MRVLANGFRFERPEMIWKKAGGGGVGKDKQGYGSVCLRDSPKPYPVARKCSLKRRQQEKIIPKWIPRAFSRVFQLL